MALKKPATDNTAPAFEDVTAVVEAERPAADAAAATTNPAAEATATAAVAVAASTSAVTVASEKARNFRQELAEMKDAMSFDWGTFPTFKADNGSIAEVGNGRLNFGTWVKGRMMAYGSFWQVSPGDSDSKLKGFVAFSKDGQTVDSVIGDGVERGFVGKSVSDYLTYLRDTEGLSKADVKEYLNVGFLVVESDKPEVDPGTVVNIVLSQSSIRSFRAYEEQVKVNARAAAMGLPHKAMSDDPFRFKFVAEATQHKGNKWTKLTLEPTA